MTDQFPYLEVMLAPAPALEFYGRCATREPPCPKFEAVFHWWKDPPKFRMLLFRKLFGPFF